jgi:hypothetical protein
MIAPATASWFETRRPHERGAMPSAVRGVLRRRTARNIDEGRLCRAARPYSCGKRLPVKPGECLRYACGATGARRRIQARAGITGWKPAGALHELARITEKGQVQFVADIARLPPGPPRCPRAKRRRSDPRSGDLEIAHKDQRQRDAKPDNTEQCRLIE